MAPFRAKSIEQSSSPGSSDDLPAGTPYTVSEMPLHESTTPVKVLLFQRNTPALAVGLDGDPFPRFVIMADGTDGIYFGDGNSDPTTGQANLAFVEGGISAISDLIFNPGVGPIIGPNSEHRVDYQNGQLGTTDTTSGTFTPASVPPVLGPTDFLDWSELAGLNFGNASTSYSFATLSKNTIIGANANIGFGNNAGSTTGQAIQPNLSDGFYHVSAQFSLTAAGNDEVTMVIGSDTATQFNHATPAGVADGFAVSYYLNVGTPQYLDFRFQTTGADRTVTCDALQIVRLGDTLADAAGGTGGAPQS